eukprot:TRINITY_DN37889_c0_g1_i1.p1 TRINITY_DN37889_c0_g1~~TRINITY_DN37889_c0_g1_i1.p1  ORF type:complete len:458 (-),score=111.38 TRINITY_DN37889_c0_g1_i1:49-1362(-)
MGCSTSREAAFHKDEGQGDLSVEEKQTGDDDPNLPDDDDVFQVDDEDSVILQQRDDGDDDGGGGQPISGGSHISQAESGKGGSEAGSTIISGMGSGMGSVPLEKIVMPRKKRISKQASGHEDMWNFMKQYEGVDDFKTGIPHYVLKQLDVAELNAYKAMQEKEDVLLRFTAKCYGQVVGAEGREFLKLENLLQGLGRGPHVMDCKIGVRSFTEEEAYNSKLRPDLYQRLIKLDSTYPTVEEHKQQAITKYRWMSFNDEFTTLRSLGFRIDGIANSSSRGKVPKSELQQARTMKDMARCIIDNFLPRIDFNDTARLSPELQEQEARLQKCVTQSILQQLKELQQVLMTSPFVKKRSLIGCSLLFAVDACGPKARVFMIDFAKSSLLPEGKRISHSNNWIPGNYEDGLFFGVESMIKLWEEMENIRADDKLQLELCARV